MTVSGLPLADARKIGFNDPVEIEGHSLHVQTEVITRDGIVIRTIVLEGGIVRFSENRPCPPEVSDLGALVAQVQSQHRERLDKIRRGGEPWLAST
jgi:hypothetical protein